MYRLSKGIVLRNIGGIFFLINIYEKDYYTERNLTVINNSGRLIFEIMLNFEYFTVQDIYQEVISLFDDPSDELKMSINADIEVFLGELFRLKFLLKEI